MINYEAMVHPAMMTHPHPRKVAIVGDKQVNTSGDVLREVLKHISVQEAVILRNEEDADTHYEGDERTSVLELNDQDCHRRFDVIIDPSPVKVVTDTSLNKYFSHLFNCLDKDGIVSIPLPVLIICILS